MKKKMLALTSFLLTFGVTTTAFAQGHVRFPIQVRKASLYYRCYNLISDNFVGTGFDPTNNFFIMFSQDVICHV